jgi:DNA-binding NarL/FixJ family response regulator
MSHPVPVLIADDHPIFRKDLRQVIEADPGVEVVGEAEDGEVALDLIRRLRPQIAVLDVDMPQKDGFVVAREIRASRLGVDVIFLTMHKNERFFNAALDLGVKGYVLKDCASSDIVSAIKAVAAGHAFVTPLLTDFLLNRRRAASLAEQETGLPSLTVSERRMLQLVASYLRVADGAGRLDGHQRAAGWGHWHGDGDEPDHSQRRFGRVHAGGECQRRDGCRYDHLEHGDGDDLWHGSGSGQQHCVRGDYGDRSNSRPLRDEDGRP